MDITKTIYYITNQIALIYYSEILLEWILKSLNLAISETMGGIKWSTL